MLAAPMLMSGDTPPCYTMFPVPGNGFRGQLYMEATGRSIEEMKLQFPKPKSPVPPMTEDARLGTCPNAPSA